MQEHQATEEQQRAIEADEYAKLVKTAAQAIQDAGVTLEDVRYYFIPNGLPMSRDEAKFSNHIQNLEGQLSELEARLVKAKAEQIAA